MAPTPIQLVIFDCDGVLVDSERLALRISMAGLARRGWQLTEGEFLEQFVGRSEASIRPALVARLGEQVADQWDEEFRRQLATAIDQELQPVPGILQALQEISIPSCVASSSGHPHLKRVLGVAGLYDRFEGRIFSATEVAHGKPAPDLFLHAARRLGVEPSACAVVEDSGHGVAAARAAGMRAFGFAGGITPVERLAGPGTVVFIDMRELPGLLGQAEGAN